MRTRLGCRLILLDPTDRLLLLRIDDPGSIVIDGLRPPPSYWITVGGGLEPDETFEEAAHRELFEETGITDVVLGPVLLDRELDVVLLDEPMHLFERCFAAWTDVVDVSFEHHTEEEQRVVTEHRWWHHDELAAPTAPPAFPERLPSLFARAIELRP